MLLFFVYEQPQFYNILMILIKFIYDKSSNIFLIYQDIVCGDFHPNILIVCGDFNPNIFICIKIYYKFNKKC